MKPLKGVLLMLLWTPAALLFSDVVNKDRPIKGEWDLSLQKVWEIDRAGSEVFLEPDRLQAAADGTLYVHDEMNRVNYIFGQDGRFVRSFGKRGQGPGEIHEQKGLFLMGQTLILVDTAKLHYFSKAGDYLKSESNYYYRRRPAAFVEEGRFIAASLGLENEFPRFFMGEKDEKEYILNGLSRAFSPHILASHRTVRPNGRRAAPAYREAERPGSFRMGRRSYADDPGCRPVDRPRHRRH
jgi:hypothetical protein